MEQCSAVVTGSTLPNFRPQRTCSLAEIPIDKEKILRIIRSLDSNKAHGCDDISVAMIKSVMNVLLNHSVIFKECLGTVVYPSRLKRANIIPVHKKGNRQNKKN